VEGHERHHEPLGGATRTRRRGPSTNGGSEWRKLVRLDKTEELIARNVGACPVGHRNSGVLGGMEAQGAVVLRMRKNSENRGYAREEEDDGKAKSRTCTRRAVLKGESAAPHLQHRARRVNETFAHARAPRQNNRPLA
jgi:hypothetical protein